MNRTRSSGRTVAAFLVAILVLMTAFAACSDGGTADQSATVTPTSSVTAEPTDGPTTSPTALPSPEPTTTPEASATSNPTASPTPTATADPEAVVLMWTREGGIAGFCDGVLLTAGHQTTLGTCEDPGAGTADSTIAPGALILEFATWREEFAPFEVEWADGPNIADGMTVRLAFIGRGTRVADEETQRAIAEFASRLFTEVSASKPRA